MLNKGSEFISNETFWTSNLERDELKQQKIILSSTPISQKEESEAIISTDIDLPNPQYIFVGHFD